MATSTGYLPIQPAENRPAIDAQSLNLIRQHTAFGAVKAVIGSEHAFVKKVKKKFPVTNAKKDQAKEIEVDFDEKIFRQVRSLHHFSHFPHRWISLDGRFEAATEDELLAKIHAVHGGPIAMSKAGLRVIYCAESTIELEVHTTKNGEPVIVSEIALMSDREVGG